MKSSVLVERPVSAGLAAAMLWLAPNQGRVVDLAAGRLQVGLVVAATRAVTCTVWMAEPGLSGSLRCVATPDAASVKLVFRGVGRESDALDLLAAVAGELEAGLRREAA